MEAIFLICGAGGPQLKRNPLGGCPDHTRAMRPCPASVLTVLALLSCGPHKPSGLLPNPVASSLLRLAEVHGDLVGIAIDSVTGTPLWGAQVIVQDSLSLTTLGTVTDSLGVFTLRGLPTGRITVTIRDLGYCPTRFTVTVPMSPDVALVARVPPGRNTTPPGSDMLSFACP